MIHVYLNWTGWWSASVDGGKEHEARCPLEAIADALAGRCRV